MIKYPKFSYTRLLFFILLITGISCKKSFDNPPGYTPPNVTANTTINDLKALHSSGNFEQITDDKIIQGIVIADDKSGNFFLNIVIQDETGGITIRLDGIGLFSSYPVGRQVFVKCKGLYLNDYNGLIQLGGGVDNTGTFPSLTTIASALIDSFVIKGSTGNVVTPKVVTLDDLGTDLQDPYLNTLIQLDGFQFADVDLGSTYADPTKTVSAINYDIEDCSGTIILRNSSYANFAGQTLPSGNGSIVAVYSIFGTDRQLLIRDTSDINFTGTRCTGGGGGTGNVLDENFESTTANDPISLPGWQNIGETGGVTYQAKSFSSNNFAQISAFMSTQAVVKSWLITPAINLDATTNEVLTFRTLDAFNNGSTLKVQYSTNYDGSSAPSTATWTDLPATIASGTTTGYAPDFTPSGDVSLNAISGASVYIAFVYEGGDPGKTTTYQLDDVKVVGN